jgi:hypothetical protein
MFSLLASERGLIELVLMIFNRMFLFREIYIQEKQLIKIYWQSFLLAELLDFEHRLDHLSHVFLILKIFI